MLLGQGYVAADTLLAVIDYRRIHAGHPLYQQECALRERVLLLDAGYTMASYVAEDPGIEERYEHFVAVTRGTGRAGGGSNGERVVGCVTLLPKPGVNGAAPSGKLAQMAVDPQRQGEGIGRRLVIEVEKRAFAELGLERVYCHAQVTAVGFYERLGWTIEGESFMEAGIEHRFMVSPGGTVRPAL